MTDIFLGSKKFMALEIINEEDYYLSEYDFNDEIKLHDSLKLFKRTLLSPIFIDKSCLPILTKKNSFEQILKQNPKEFKEEFTDFKRDLVDVDECIGHYKNALIN